jgi:hypothetical protein
MSHMPRKMIHLISMSYADFHQTAAAPRNMKRNMKPNRHPCAAKRKRGFAGLGFASYRAPRKSKQPDKKSRRVRVGGPEARRDTLMA